MLAFCSSIFKGNGEFVLPIQLQRGLRLDCGIFGRYMGGKVVLTLKQPLLSSSRGLIVDGTCILNWFDNFGHIHITQPV